MNKIRLALAAGVIALAGTTSAYAGHDDIGWSISIGSSGGHHYHAPRVVYEPRIVYYEPAPIHYHYDTHRHYRPRAYHGGHHGHGNKHHKHGSRGHHRGHH